jgi:hypothetical protein
LTPEQTITVIAEIEQRLAQLDAMEQRLARPVHKLADDELPFNDGCTRHRCY